MRISYWSSDVCSSDLVGCEFAKPPTKPLQGIIAGYLCVLVAADHFHKDYASASFSRALMTEKRCLIARGAPWRLCGLHRRQPARVDFGPLRLWCAILPPYWSAST